MYNQVFLSKPGKMCTKEKISLVQKITIFPLKEKSNKFRDHIRREFEGTPEADNNPWEKTIQWFNEQKDFIDAAMVYIGEDITDGNEKDWPKGTEMSPSCLPRIILGLTKNGSLTGLFGYVVYT
uniref:Uncharacterized protein n=1 Tax=Panagrolaimus davidi TaxID=227884 RepID=A0A914PWU0_9BILA